MKIHRFAALLLAFVLIFGLAACSEGGGTTATVYLLAPLGSADGAHTVEVTITVPEGEDAGEAAMRALIDPPERADGISPYIDGVKLESVTYYGGIATVNLSREYLEMKGYALAEAEGCAALTMLAVGRVSSVRFLVDGEPHPDGEQGFLSAGGIVSEDVGTQSLERELTLYFLSAETGRLAAERRGIVMREGEPVERYVLEELIKGPAQDGLERTLPENLEIHAIESETGACLVDFSEEFDEVSGGDRMSEHFALASIVNSLAASTAVETVFLSSDGESLYRGAALGECRGEIDPFNYASFELWLPSNDGEHVEPVSMLLGIAGAYSLDRLLIEYFIGGMDGAGFDAALPPDTRVLQLSCSSAHCYIDFSEELVQNSEDEASVRLALEALAHTLNANGYGSFGVEVSVDGDPYAFVKADAERIHPDFTE